MKTQKLAFNTTPTHITFNKPLNQETLSLKASSESERDGTKQRSNGTNTIARTNASSTTVTTKNTIRQTSSGLNSAVQEARAANRLNSLVKGSLSSKEDAVTQTWSISKVGLEGHERGEDGAGACDAEFVLGFIGLEEEEGSVARLEVVVVGCEGLLRAGVEGRRGWWGIEGLGTTAVARVILRADGLVEGVGNVEGVVDYKDVLVSASGKLCVASGVELCESGADARLRARV